MEHETKVTDERKSEQSTTLIDRTQLKHDIDWLEARVDKEEQKLERLMQEIFTEEETESNGHLEAKMRNNKGLVETARKNWDQAAAAYLGESKDGNKKAASFISKANDALLQILE